MINFPTPSHTLANKIPTLLGLSLQKVPLSVGVATYSLPLFRTPTSLKNNFYNVMKALTIWWKSAINGSGLERFHCISRTKEDFINLGCFQRATLKVNDVLSEISNRRTHSKGANHFKNTSVCLSYFQSVFHEFWSQLFFYINPPSQSRNTKKTANEKKSRLP